MNGPTPIMFIRLSEVALPSVMFRPEAAGGLTGAGSFECGTGCELYTSGVPATFSRSFRSALCAGASLLLSMTAPAQTVPWATTFAPAVDAAPLPEDRGAAALPQTLRKLRGWGSLLMIVAHPDDEDGGMMAYESRGLGIRTALLTLTRGEGGQNAMGVESYDALGLIRTNELLLADRYSGTEQLWGTVADYGFSKTREEAFAQWGRERVLRDVVRAVRQQRPLVLTSVFLGGVTDGHGHHQVAGELTQEAFKLAGDPAVFPDQIAAGLRPWQPLAVFERTPFAPVTAKGMYDYATDSWVPPSFINYVTGERSAAPPAPDVTIPEGAWDPLLGRSYLQMAREGWGLQKSQYGGGNPPLPGPDPVPYHRYGSRVGTGESFFSNIDTTLPGMARLAQGADSAFVTAGLQRMDRAVASASAAYRPENPAASAPALREAYLATQALLDAVGRSGLTADSKADLAHELGIKLVQCNTALAEALGLELDALVAPSGGERGLAPDVSRTHVTPGESFTARLRVAAAGPWSREPGPGLSLAHVELVTPRSEQWTVERAAGPGSEAATAGAGDVVFRVTVPANAEPTEPYFTRASIEQAFYDLSEPALAGQSFAPYPVFGSVIFLYGGVPVRLSQVVQGVERERGPGNLRYPLVVTPGLSVTLPRTVAVLPAGQHELTVEASVANEQAAPASAALALSAPAGWQVRPASFALTLAPGERATQHFAVTVPEGEGVGDLQATAMAGDRRYSSGFFTVGYPGLRPYNLHRPATLRVRPVEVRVAPGVRVGYVEGTGDEVPAALAAMGVPVDLLTPADLLTRELHGYTTILLGVRTYTAAPALAQAQGALERFAREGGTVIVQYQSGDFPGVPFALRLGSVPARVVDERSTVSLPAPANPLLTTPNRITAADFQGWVEERGHGFAASWAPEWTSLVATADPGQAPQGGGLLAARLGRGRYIYVALALYRQLPEGVPGAYRLLANLVSAGVSP